MQEACIQQLQQLLNQTGQLLTINHHEFLQHMLQEVLAQVQGHPGLHQDHRHIEFMTVHRFHPKVVRILHVIHQKLYSVEED